MSVETVLQTVDNDVKNFWTRLKADVIKGKAIWNLISGTQTRAAMIAVFTDVVKTVEDSEALVTAPTNITLQAATFNDVKLLITDVKAGEGVLVADFKAIGIILKTPPKPVATTAVAAATEA